MMRTGTRARRRLTVWLGATLAVASLAATAGADDVANRLDTSIDAVAEVMPLNAGGTNGTTKMYIKPRDGDGKGGCNLSRTTMLSVSVASSNTAVATVSPTSLEFTNCDDDKVLTVTPVAGGSATVGLTETANTTAGTFNLASAKFTVNVAGPANTAPSISVDGVMGGDVYDKGSVPAATCKVTDAEDGNKSFAATLSAITGTYASDGIGSQTASCSYTDRGGLVASSSVTYGIGDPSAPVIGYTLTPATADGTNGWYTSSVSLDWTVTDSQSPNSLARTGCADQSITVDQDATTYSCSATSAGGSTGPVNVTIKRDATAPTNVTFDSAVPAHGREYKPSDLPATIGCTAFDATSDIASCVVNGLSTAAGYHTLTAKATDNAGNETTVSRRYFVDRTPPAISSSLTPAAPDGDNGWYTGNVTLDWTVSEPETPTSLHMIGCDDESITADQAATTYSCSATSVGGSSGPESVTIKRDGTAPTNVAFNADVAAAGGRYFPTTVPTGTGCTALDATSGVDSCNVTGRTTAVGTHTLTATATDNAGNQTTATRTYSVRTLMVSGFFQPVDMNGVVNTVKAGSTVPLKFTVSDEGVAQTATSVVKSFTTRQVTCGSLASSSDEIEIVSTGGTVLRYDATGGQFIQNWQTPKAAGNCYVVTVTMIDGSTIAANFKLR